MEKIVYKGLMSVLKGYYRELLMHFHKVRYLLTRDTLKETDQS